MRPRLRPYVASAIAIVVLLVPLIAFAAFTRATALSRLEADDVYDRVQAVTTGASIVRAGIDNARATLELLSRRAAVRDALSRRDTTALARDVADIKGSTPNVTFAGALDPSGILLALDPPDPVIGQSFADREYYRGALNARGAFVSNGFAGRTAGNPTVVVVALAVRDDTRVVGILLLALTPQDLLPLLTPLGTQAGRDFLLVGGDGRLIAATDSTAPLTPLNTPRSDAPRSVRADLLGRDRLLGTAPVAGTGWSFIVSDDPRTALGPLEDLERVMFAAFAVAALLVIAAGAFVGVAFVQRQRAAEEVAAALAAQRSVNEQLRELDQRKDEFVSVVSHEFRTPLTGILGFSEMMRDEELADGEIKEFANDIHRDAERLARMINDMLELDRMRSGRLRLRLGPVDLSAIAREAAELARPNSPQHRIETDLDPSLPQIYGDSDRITQVVTNLLSNAVKYSPAGGTVTLRTSRDGDTAALSVTDEGIGIPEDELERVFEKFTRVESKAMRDIQGTGLGLPIVRQIVEMHGGRVWVESVIGKGSTFHVALPLTRVPEPVPA